MGSNMFVVCLRNTTKPCIAHGKAHDKGHMTNNSRQRELCRVFFVAHSVEFAVCETLDKYFGKTSKKKSASPTNRSPLPPPARHHCWPATLLVLVGPRRSRPPPEFAPRRSASARPGRHLVHAALLCLARRCCGPLCPHVSHPPAATAPLLLVCRRDASCSAPPGTRER